MTNAIVKISDGEIVAATELIITGLSADYFKYEIVASKLRAVTQTQTNLVIRTSTDNGTSFTGGSNTYAWFLQRSSGLGNGNTAAYSGGATRGFVINGLSNISGNWEGANIEIYNPMNAIGRTTIITRSAGKLNADGRTDNPNVQMCISQRTTLEANNAIRLFIESDSSVTGDFSMRYVVYGYVA